MLGERISAICYHDLHKQLAEQTYAIKYKISPGKHGKGITCICRDEHCNKQHWDVLTKAGKYVNMRTKKISISTDRPTTETTVAMTPESNNAAGNKPSAYYDTSTENASCACRRPTEKQLAGIVIIIYLFL